MVNATIDNSPVSIQLGINQSTTVPTNETWKVTLSVFGKGGLDENGRVFIQINGTPAFGLVGDMNNGGAVNSPSDSFVLAGGDTLTLAGGIGVDGAAIQGFVVDS